MIEAEGGIFGIIGDKLVHSITPKLMNHLAVQLERPERFQAIELAPEALPAFIEHALHSPRVLLNVTSPFKEEVIAYLEFISGDAEDVNAVNIITGGNGHLRGYNADIEGFMAPDAFLSEIKWENERQNILPTALILGSGGAASAAAVGLARTWGEGRLVFLARNHERLQNKVSHLREHYADSNVEFIATVSKDDAWEKVCQDEGALYLLINTTPIGQWPDAGDDPFKSFGLNDDTLHKFSYYYDAIYNPIQTSAMKRMASLNAKVAGGFDWFCRQAVLSAEVFFDHRPSEDAIHRFVMTELTIRP